MKIFFLFAVDFLKRLESNYASVWIRQAHAEMIGGCWLRDYK